MQVKRLVWMGVRREKVDAMEQFFRGAMSLRLTRPEASFAVFLLPNGDQVELFGPRQESHSHFTSGSVVGFLVDDIGQARAELEAAGVDFLGPTQIAQEGYAWAHFRAPDGTIFELTYDPARS